jgi:pyridoxal phosphate enzyme (YggS family)
MDVRERILEVQKRIADAAVLSRREPEEITLLAVTKTFPVETIRWAYEAGLREFGENRVQEALAKINELPKDVRWHLIGQLQTNKINKVIGKFELIHSIDSLHLAETFEVRLGAAAQSVLLEVHTSEEQSKAGVAPGLALETAEKISKLPGLKLRGLMTVGPLTDNPQKLRDAFKKLKELFESIKARKIAGDNFSILSMGMSGDFEMAIEEGSTLVRVGTALFGSR